MTTKLFLIISFACITYSLQYSFVKEALSERIQRNYDIYKADVVVYGATASGIAAAISAANESKLVHLVYPEQKRNIGGMVSGGLGHSDTGNTKVIGGFANTFAERVGKVYGKTGAVWDFEPHVTRDVFEDWLGEFSSSIRLFPGERIESVSKKGSVLESFKTATGSVFQGLAFIDCSYEGDLMALSGVSYTWGREGESKYNESLAGRLPVPNNHGDHQFYVTVDPYDKDHKLLPLVYGGNTTVFHDGDKKVQSYNFRMCFSSDKSNQVPFEKPEGYDEKDWELLTRYLIAENNKTTIHDLMILSELPNNKFDINNHGPISTDYINHAWEYPEASWTRKLEIYDEHVKYTQGFFYFLANSPNSPENVRESMKGLGLAKDEFVDTNNWPFQLYVREARRMIGTYIMTQHDRTDTIHKDDSIGVGSYNIDTHHCQRFPQGDGVINEGDIEAHFSNTFELPYSCITPRDSEATNLLVPVCVSASHIGYGPIRLEPQYMILGQSAGVAAAMAIKSGSTVQQVNIKELQNRLLELGQILVAEK